MSYDKRIDLTTEEESASEPTLAASASGPVFNAFRIQNATDLEWETALYEVNKIDGVNKDEDRGEITRTAGVSFTALPQPLLLPRSSAP